MVHDRRIDGEAHTFGNQGALFLGAMTWWDHETGSIWSQPWGAAIGGPLKGTRLRLIPASMVPWDTWIADHPETLLLEVVGAQGLSAPAEAFTAHYVIGVALGEHAKSYPFQAASRAGIISDRLGPFPVVVLVDAASKAVRVYLRRARGTDLDFTLRDGQLVDRQTASTWDVATGIALDGPLKGELLTQVPYTPAFDWAWEDFYPDSEVYEGEG